ncbi:hypothetical protein TPHA_0F02610 [Tetrapisispora phaffii CBS 4417]|uniref:Condensin complex subunit 1 n=1 Tax=Tetrapisispora phaffii (strain ATCC 24235 / CBS 4417 / NBRC 1672 / NRRL Y-8282 / UCD 70-5) TaxID=1071381 RepID=G8BUF5_TETPH|nr:hypothetical protein TPHA_0F02610 [Tetrapisispora phaffii CBS 4417]CCE63741.1 hypothetical protein TPHA_0F02610 [Tetrapisispora phaffii CBS 4417]
MSEFSLSKYLTTFQTTEKRSYLPVEDASRELNTIIDRLAISPEQINSDPEIFESLTDLCHGFPHLPMKLQTQLTYLVASFVTNVANDISSTLVNKTSGDEIIELIANWKIYLEQYGYLMHVLLTFLHDDIHIAALQSSNFARGVGGSSNKKANTNPNIELFKRSCSQIESIVDAILKILQLNLSRIFQTTPERDLFISLFIRPLYVIVEVEPIVKLNHLKSFIQRALALSVKNHGQSSAIKASIMSTLTYFLHLSHFNAELLHLLNEQYDYPQLTEDILKEISTRVFNAKDTTGPKAISNFLIKLSELSSHIMLRQMSLVIRLLNNSSITLRCSVVESCGNIVTAIMKNSELLDHYKQQVLVLVKLLEERFQDSNPYVRTKAIQSCIKICQLDIKINKVRSNFLLLAIRSLEDKSSLVRRNSVKLLSKLLLTHPFSGLDGNQLILTNWKKLLDEAHNELDKYQENNENYDISVNNIDDDIINKDVTIDMDVNTKNTSSNIINKNGVETDEANNQLSNKITKLKLMVAYFEEAVEFISNLHRAIFLASGLLSSRNRNEVLETMDFLVLAGTYSLEPSGECIKHMLHLVWMKGATDEGTSIQSHLMTCYNQLFLTTPPEFNYKQRANYIANNLIKLTERSSLADLASLEQLLILMHKEKLIDDNVVVVLWAIYNAASLTSSMEEKTQIHGAIIIIGMLALSDSNIALKGYVTLLNIGLGEIGMKDMIICRYSCLALERMTPENNLSSSHEVDMKHDEESVKKLYSIIILYSTDPEYYPMCEQAIRTLFRISRTPDKIANDIIKEKTMMTFGSASEIDSVDNQSISRVTSLSQLLFIVGQVAVRTLIFLDSCETEFKKRKHETEIRNSKDKEKVKDAVVNELNTDEADESKDNELAMIGGTNEDDFADAIQVIKENDLLFGPDCLLGKFCPLVEEIISSSNDRYNDVMLQRTATLCLEKLMCVSSKYCEKSLPLLITVMEKSPDPIVRSNAVLGLGDMAVCFNNLVDENTDYLYRRLHDESLMVQRTCLMTVTFLILAGQVKVKGQLGEMAKCLENSDQGISDMCKLFFTELATKDNAIYNGFIDIFSNLSSDEDLKKDSFKNIIKFLLSFIVKERHQKQLSEKLSIRLNKCSDQQQWDDIAFVLNTLPHKNEKITEMLSEGFKVVNARD